MPQPIKYQYVTFLVLSTPPKLAKNAPTICFLIFCTLLSGQTYKYRVLAKGVPRTRVGKFYTAKSQPRNIRNNERLLAVAVFIFVLTINSATRLRYSLC